MIRKLFQRFVKVFWLLPGFLLWASFPPMGETTDSLFALAPLLWLVRNSDVKTNVRRWFINGLIFWFATLSWMPAIVKNGGPWPLVVLGWGALAVYCALYFAAFGYWGAKYWTWAKERGGYGLRLLGLLLVEPILWAGLELVRSNLFGGFSWNHLGVASVNGGFGAPAAIGGIYLVSALVLLVNGTLASIAERMLAPYFAARPHYIVIHGQRLRAAAPKIGFVVPNWVRSIETLLPFLVIFGVYGVSKKVATRPLQDGTTLSVAMIQRNFPCCFQGTDDDTAAIYSNLLSHVAFLKPDLVVLPESAMAEFGPIDGFRARHAAREMSNATSGAAILAGGGRRAAGREYNSAGLYVGGDLQIYDKVHLVPFGEYIPGDKWITALQKLAPVGSCTSGTLKHLHLPIADSDCNGLLGVAICFEDTDSAQMRLLAKQDAQLLVFITNDSWFSHSDEAVQHAWQARARAIETGLPVVRVGNSGVTGTILPDGTALWLVDSDGKPLVDQQGSMFDRVVLPPTHCGARTPYVALGDIPLASTFALLILLMILINYRDYAKRRTLSM